MYALYQRCRQTLELTASGYRLPEFRRTVVDTSSTTAASTSFTPAAPFRLPDHADCTNVERDFVNASECSPIENLAAVRLNFRKADVDPIPMQSTMSAAAAPRREHALRRGLAKQRRLAGCGAAYASRSR